MGTVVNPIGILQGRLSPSDGRGLLDFPVKTWEREFAVAREVGFDAIEWLLDGTPEANPLWSQQGVDRIRDLSQRYRLSIPSLCASCFMFNRLTSANSREPGRTNSLLVELIHRCAATGIGCILLPFFDQNALDKPEAREETITTLRSAAPIAEACKVDLALETALPVEDLLDLLRQVNHSRVRVYYDLGNATAWGYDVVQEIRQLGSRIAGVHVKDRLRSGPNVPPGTGDTDFAAAFCTLREVGYTGSYILETPLMVKSVPILRHFLTRVLEYLATT